MVDLTEIPNGSQVVCKWIDTNTESAWMDQKLFMTKGPSQCATVGVWMGISKGCVHIAHNITEDQCDGTVIPLGVIKKVRITRNAKSHSR